FEFEIRGLSIGAGRANEVMAVLRREDVSHSVLFERCAVEAPENRFHIGFLHRQSVMRRTPALRFARVAFGADSRTDETRSLKAFGRVLGASGQGKDAKSKRRDEEGRNAPGLCERSKPCSAG